MDKTRIRLFKSETLAKCFILSSSRHSTDFWVNHYIYFQTKNICDVACLCGTSNFLIVFMRFFLCYSNPIVNGTFLPCANKNGCTQIPTPCKYSCVCIISLKIGLACFLWSIWIFRILKSLLSNLIWWRNLFNPDTPTALTNWSLVNFIFYQP